MMRKLLASLVVAFVATGCAVAPSDGEGVGESAEALAKASVSNSDTSSLSCPAAGTCNKADILCVTPGDYWCNILTRCIDCGWPVDYATAGEQESLAAGGEAAPQEARAADSEAAPQEARATGGETNLSCPAAGTCQKADTLCVTPGDYWCNILTRCMDCGWPVDYATAGEQESLAAGGEAAPQEARAKAGEAAPQEARTGETNLSCPPSGTCDKADRYCQDPEVDVYWCGIWARCLDCYL